MKKHKLMDLIIMDYIKTTDIDIFNKGKAEKKIKMINSCLRKNGSRYIISDYQLSMYTKDNSNKIKALSSFFIMPRFELSLNYGKKSEKYLLLSAYFFEDLEIQINEEFDTNNVSVISNRFNRQINQCGTRTDFVIRKSELSNSDWIHKYLDTEKSKLYGEYEYIREAINILAKSEICKKREIYGDNGWIYNKDLNSWKYNTKRTCFKCWPKRTEITSAFFKDIIETLEVDPKGNCLFIFLYGLLALQYEFLKQEQMAPKFILNVIGSKKDYSTHIVEYFANAMNIEKGNIVNCEAQKTKRCSFYNDEFVTDSLDDRQNIENVLKSNKDKLVVLDCILRRDYRSIFQMIKISTIRKKGVFNVPESEFNSLPIIITNESASLCEEDFVKAIDFDSKSLNLEKLKELRRQESTLNYITYRYIIWLKALVNNKRKDYMSSLLTEYKKKFREIYYNNIELKEKDSYIAAWFLVAFDSYLDFARTEEFIKADDAIILYNKVYKIITGADCNNGEYKEKGFTGDVKNENDCKTKILHDCLEVIKHIYEHQQEKLCKVRDRKRETDIGWLLYNKLLCIDRDEFNNLILQYVKDNEDIEIDRNITYTYELIYDIIYCENNADSIVEINNGKNQSGNIRYEYRIPYLKESITKPSGKNGENKGKKSANTIAFIIDKVFEELNK